MVGKTSVAKCKALTGSAVKVRIVITVSFCFRVSCGKVN